MKKLIAAVLLLLSASFVTLNVSYAAVMEEDFSSSAGWNYSNYHYATLNGSTRYNAEKHTEITFKDGILSVGSGWGIKAFSPISGGICETELELKLKDKGAAVLASADGSVVTGIYYYDGSININHEYGLSELKGAFAAKLPRRSTDEFYSLSLKADLESGEVSLSINGEEIEGFELRTKAAPTRIAITGAEVKRLKISNYYKTETSVNNLYGKGLTITAQQELPSDASLFAALYSGERLLSVHEGENGAVTVDTAGADSLKAFIWRDAELEPLTPEAVKLKKAADTTEAAKQLLYDFEAENPTKVFDLSKIQNADFLQMDGIELYSREIPDDTKLLRNENGFAKINKTPTWYSGGDREEKSKQLLDYTYELSGKRLSDGYSVNTSRNPLYYVLIGDIETAESVIADKTGGYTFTDMSAYYLYFKYRSLLSDTAIENLKTTIYNECQNPKSGFAWYKGEGEVSTGAHHNQTYDGLVRGLLFAYTFKDDSDPERAELAADVLKRSEDILDKVIASTASTGYATGDYNSPSYGAMIWADLICLSDLLPESDTKAKADTLLARVDAENAVLYHAQTSNTVGPYARSGFNLAAGLNMRQNYPLMMYALSDRNGFYKNLESSDRSFFYPLLAAYTHKLPDYIQSIAFDKTYPYSVKVTKLRNSTPGEYTIDAGNQTTHDGTAYKQQETTGYMTASYSLGSAPDTAWYTPGLRGADTAFIARWKRTDTVKSLSDTPTLTSYYRYNIGRESELTGYSQPKEQGLSAVAQDKNRAIVYSYPGKVTDEKLASELEAYGGSIYNMGTAIYITNPEDTKIYFGDTLAAGEEIIAENGTEELRARLNMLPYRCESCTEPIYLEDKSVYAAIIPLNSGCTAELRSVGADAGDNKTAVSAYSVNLYNVCGTEAVTLTEAERAAMQNGYIFEIAERSEYSSLEEFKAHIKAASILQSTQNGIWFTSYTSGGDTLTLSYDTDNLWVSEITVNGTTQKNVFYNIKAEDGTLLYTKTADEGYYNWLGSEVYIENPTVFESENLIQSRAAEISIGDCTLENPSGAMVYVVYSAKDSTYLVGDLTAGQNSFLLKTPYGNVKIDSLDIGTVEYKGSTGTVTLNKKVSDTAAKAAAEK